MARRRCKTLGCDHYVREGLRNFHLENGADGEHCWRCRRALRMGIESEDRSFFTVGQHDLPADLPSPEDFEQQLRDAWGPEAMAASDRLRRELAMPQEEFDKLRGL